MIFVWFALLEICGGVSALSSPSNQYMDLVLSANIQYAGTNWNIDPATLANFSSEYETSVMFVDVDVKIDYYSVQMTGLFKGERARDCSPVRRGSFNNVTLNCTLVFKDIKIIFEGKMKFGKLPKMRITAEASFTPSFAFIEVTSRNDYNYPTLTQLYLTETGVVNMKLSGTGPFNNKLKKLVKDDLANRASIDFLNVFVYNYRAAMARAVAFTPMPV